MKLHLNECNIYNHEILIEDCYVDNVTSRIGYFDNFEVFIITDDVVQIPHIHIRNKRKHKYFSCCVRLDKPEYIPHNNKLDKLDYKQLISFIKFLNTEDKYSNLPMYESILCHWNDNNYMYQISENTPLPDYMQLK